MIICDVRRSFSAVFLKKNQGEEKKEEKKTTTTTTTKQKDRNYDGIRWRKKRRESIRRTMQNIRRRLAVSEKDSYGVRRCWWLVHCWIGRNLEESLELTNERRWNIWVVFWASSRWTDWFSLVPFVMRLGTNAAAAACHPYLFNQAEWM